MARAVCRIEFSDVLRRFNTIEDDPLADGIKSRN
jgi:hypothetical protein